MQCEFVSMVLRRLQQTAFVSLSLMLPTGGMRRRRKNFVSLCGWWGMSLRCSQLGRTAGQLAKERVRLCACLLRIIPLIFFKLRTAKGIFFFCYFFAIFFVRRPTRQHTPEPKQKLGWGPESSLLLPLQLQLLLLLLLLFLLFLSLCRSLAFSLSLSLSLCSGAALGWELKVVVVVVAAVFLPRTFSTAGS